MQNDLIWKSATELAALIRSGEVSSVEVVGAFIDRIGLVNTMLNAVVVERFDEALDEAGSADRELASRAPDAKLLGVPMTVKETLSVAGTHECAGVESLARVASDDATVVRCLRSAGAIVIAKTNVSQFLWFNEADNPVHGRTNNPWDLSRATGGSSGGEGAIIASGGSPMGMGTDSGGSSRSPAHFCGIHALKPTSGLLSTTGSLDDVIFAGQEAVVNQPCPMARSVDDLGMMLGMLAARRDGWDEGARGRLVPNVPARFEPKRPRIGFFRSCPGYPVAEPVLRALEDSLVQLDQAGCRIREVDPPDLAGCMHLFNQIFVADGGDNLKDLAKSSQLDRRVERALAETSGARLGVHQYWRLLAERTRYARDCLRKLDASGVDILLCPPDSGLAFEHGASSEMAGQAYAALFNLLGLPAGVVTVSAGVRARALDSAVAQPLNSSDRGLPVGVQVVGRFWHERSVLRIMRLLESSGLGTDSLN